MAIANMIYHVCCGVLVVGGGGVDHAYSVVGGVGVVHVVGFVSVWLLVVVMMIRMVRWLSLLFPKRAVMGL